MWRRCCYSIALICLCVSAWAVTQEGVVRTVARKGKTGKPLDGVRIRVRGEHNMVQSRRNGDFSILLYNLSNGDPYSIASIVKSGYEPSEQELIGKKLPCSDKVPLEILLVKSSDLLAEKEAIAAEARKNVEKYYRQQVKELKQLQRDQQLSEADYKQRLDELEARYERFEPLVRTMADKFARMDYSRMDSISRLIQEAIERGDPEETERLVREKGNLDAREAAIRAKDQDIAQAQQAIDEAQARVDEERVLNDKDKRDLAEDYYKLYASFLSRFMNDSAEMYIRRRAELDTLNVDYQLQAGQFAKEMMADYPLARKYFERAYRICLAQYEEQSGQMATTCHELGSVSKLQGDLEAAMRWYERSLAIREQLRGKDSPAVAETLNNMGELYRTMKDMAQAESCHLRALKIREQHFDKRSPEVGESKNNLAGVYFQQKQYDRAETLWREVHDIYAADPQTPPCRIADNGINLGAVLYKQGHYSDALAYFEQALAIYTKVLGAAHPQTRKAEKMIELCHKKMNQ